MKLLKNKKYYLKERTINYKMKLNHCFFLMKEAACIMHAMCKRKNVMGSGTTKRCWHNAENNLLTPVCYVGKTYHMD